VVDEGAFISELSARVTSFCGQGIWETLQGRAGALEHEAEGAGPQGAVGVLVEVEGGHVHDAERVGQAGSGDGPGGFDFPRVSQVARIRRDRYDIDGTLISKEIVHAATSLEEEQAGPADLAHIARGQWGIESVHWVRDTATPKTRTPNTPATAPRSWPRCGFAISLLYLSGVTEITRTLQAIARDRTRILGYLPP
jgi:hypothetical protein